MIKHKDSHVDHGLTEAQLHYLLDRFADRDGFFIETITLPRELGTVPCGLYGPVMGDPAIVDNEVTYAARGSRAWTSRLIDLPSRQQHEVTVIAGPHEAPCEKCEGKGERLSLSLTVQFSTHGEQIYCPCEACHATGKVAHACVLYTAFGGPVAPREPGDVRQEMEKLHQQRASRDATQGDPANGCSDESERARLDPEIYGKIVALRAKRAEADAFWGEHALAK